MDSLPGTSGTSGWQPSIDLQPVYTVTYNEVTRKMKVLKTSNLSKNFGLFPQSITLVSEDGFVEVPNEEGEFVNIDEFITWNVEGEKMNTGQSFMPQKLAYQPPDCKKGAKRKSWTPSYSTSVMHRNSGPNRPPGVLNQETKVVSLEKEWGRKVDICKWDGLIWTKTNNIHMTLTESTASVPYIADTIAADIFDGERTVLLDSEYLEILNTTGTKGAKFWKGNRRICAVKVSEYLLFKRGNSADDSDFEDPVMAKPDKGKKKMKVDTSQTKLHSEPPNEKSGTSVIMQLGALEYRVNRLESAGKDIKDIEAELLSEKQKLSECTNEKDALFVRNNNLQGELQSMQQRVTSTQEKLNKVKDTFKCLICSGLVFPCLVSPCCKVVIGCAICAQRWIDENNTCPHCRAELITEQCKIIPAIHSLEDALQDEIIID